MLNTLIPDVIVVGAGIFGLWQARHALKRGERVLMLEKRQVGAGASGGFLGALMPHMPDTWNAKKQMQFDGLSTLGDAISELEADTGMDCGYRRCGRLMPLKHERMVAHVEVRIAGANENWVDAAGNKFATMEHVASEDLTKRFTTPDGQSWFAPELAAYGAQYDTLSARVNPRAYLAALATYVREHSKGDIRDGASVVDVQSVADEVTVTLVDGETLAAGRAVIANGWEAYDLLGRIGAQTGGQLLTGRGVKGQAVLLERRHRDDLPILYDDGSYVIPHGAGMGMDGEGLPNRIAVGATSVNDWLPLDLQAGEASKAGSLRKVAADHPERSAGVEPARYRDGLLPEFREVSALSKLARERDIDVQTESFAGVVSKDDPLAAKLLEAARTAYADDDTGFLEHAQAMCPSLNGASIAERWANIRPRNTLRDPQTGKIGTEPIFGTLEGNERISVAVGGFKISFGVGHLREFGCTELQVSNLLKDNPTPTG